jgi:pSer/pThr/pTyr-binding forkhead associated (FHA) protein
VSPLIKTFKMESRENPYCSTVVHDYDCAMNTNDIFLSPVCEQSVFLIVNKQIIPLTKKVTTLGRQLANDIVFHEEYLSRFHAEIVHENGEFVLYDKKSTSGTFVNSKKIDSCVLNSGDLISVANIIIMFVNNNPKITGKSIGTTQSLQQKTTQPKGSNHE